MAATNPKNGVQMTSTCTIKINAKGDCCGKPAVTSFIASDGVTEFAECADHAVFSAPKTAGYAVGDFATVQRHGKDYVGQVVKVTRTKVYVEVTYGNGRTRVVAI